VSDPATTTYDDLILGAGMAGLTLGALLADAGRKVLLLEAHEYPGGYAHTFQKGPYRFCAQVHYVFYCGEGEPIHRLLSRLGLADEVRWNRLDPEGFDVVVVGGERHRIPNGLGKSRDRLIHRYPDAAEPLKAYFQAVSRVREELDDIPETIRVRDLLTAPYRFFDLIRYRGWTLQDFYDSVSMPPRLQAVLAGQCGDYFLPPERVAFLIHAALVSSYDRGAYYPERHFEHFIGSLTDVVAGAEGCDVLYQREVARIEHEGGAVTAVHTASGETYRARRYLSNIDPARTAQLAGIDDPQADYEYSASAFTLYLGLEGVDLREHGFGRSNIWHYPDDDINAAYRRQLEKNDFSPRGAPDPGGHHLRGLRVVPGAPGALGEGLQPRQERAARSGPRHPRGGVRTGHPGSREAETHWLSYDERALLLGAGGQRLRGRAHAGQHLPGARAAPDATREPLRGERNGRLPGHRRHRASGDGPLRGPHWRRGLVLFPQLAV
jgi:hypothetical protein